ncbi:MAG: hypothetical protein CMN30_16155 [Sandaracinus sp.]|nr:hypothetical protein [Sandaracinus sp.]
MNKKILHLMTLLALGSAMVFTGCGDDDGDDDDDTTVTMDLGTDDMGGEEPDMNVTPAEPRGMDNPPTITGQIDRAGRPGVTTALVGTFTMTDDDAREALKDDYNADADTSNWATYADTIHAQLAVIDGLDGTCGNQFGYDVDLEGGPVTTDYDFLAAVLANDRVWVNGAKTNCADTYLGYELEVLGILEDGGCGGRIPSTDVIDITYSVLAAGLPALSPSPAVGDGVDMDDATTSTTAFPYLAAP